MKAELIIPIETLRGQLRKDGYYFRVYRGEQIVQRCPRTWKDTPARKAARERFVEKSARRNSGEEWTEREEKLASDAGLTDEEEPASQARQ